MDLTLIEAQLPLLLDASTMTVSLTVLSLVISSVAGMLLAIVRESRTPLSRVVAAYSWFLLGVPELLLLFLAYYGLLSTGSCCLPSRSACWR